MFQVPVESLNLAVCDIMTYFIDKSAISLEMLWVGQVHEYVISCLKGRELDASQIKVIIKIIKKLIVVSTCDGEKVMLYVSTFIKIIFSILERRKKMFYLETRPRHFIYDFIVSDIW